MGMQAQREQSICSALFTKETVPIAPYRVTQNRSRVLLLPARVKKILGVVQPPVVVSRQIKVICKPMAPLRYVFTRESA